MHRPILPAILSLDLASTTYGKPVMQFRPMSFVQIEFEGLSGATGARYGLFSAAIVKDASIQEKQISNINACIAGQTTAGPRLPWMASSSNGDDGHDSVVEVGCIAVTDCTYHHTWYILR
ncbi:hypothetical protein IAQ61_011229 [Plenodomus lingam]|uniref:uncharacterized protein n=1 Tax=Leptosphaeria maculans TaxID=5022 RepID=UPI00332D9CE2|nr:hypothetical protein IAQ61_011229 [Plenodomus lingam]